MKSKFVWKVLSEDGLLKEPFYKTQFGYEESLNGYSGGYDSEFEAQEAVVEAKLEADSYRFPHELVLVKIFEP